MHRAHARHGVQAAHARNVEIQDDQVDPELPDDIDGGLAVVGFPYMVDARQFRQLGLQGEPQRRVIVDDQDGCHALLARPIAVGLLLHMASQYKDGSGRRKCDASANAVGNFRNQSESCARPASGQAAAAAMALRRPKK